MKVLVIGSGGREHALVWKLSQSPRIKALFCAPGNHGMAKAARCLDINPDQLEALRDFAVREGVDLTVVGPDDCLAAGVVDVFQEAGLKIFGPTRKAARIESSKGYAKRLMARAGIPTASYAEFEDHREASGYLASQKYPLVIKADGLALGKGVMICRSQEEAHQALKAMMLDSAFGPAGRRVIIEEFLAGREMSIHAFCDGRSARLFPAARDHKAVFDGDRGPNTGGMGTLAPLPWATPEMMADIRQQVVEPILQAMADDGNPFVGCLYPGLIETEEGFKVLEFNARFGDPETQSFMRLLKTDLVDVFQACIEGRLAELKIEWRDGSACCLVAASGGYPGEYLKGIEISGLERAGERPEVVIFQAGTRAENGRLVTAGGRVLGVTAWGRDLDQALERGYGALSEIKFTGMHYRTDIGRKVQA
jgi:phosphoribosylamine--glycine ligase